jgi:hypothetical protein
LGLTCGRGSVAGQWHRACTAAEPARRPRARAVPDQA